MGRFGDFFDARIHRNPPPSDAPTPKAEPESIVVPKLAEVVGGVVALLRQDGRASIPVVDGSSSPRWPRVFVLGQLSPDGHDAGSALAEVVLDGSGRLALFHEVQVAAHGAWVVPVGSSALEYRYRQQLGEIGTSREQQTFPITLDRGGELMIKAVWRPEFGEEVPLSDFLYTLAAQGSGLSALRHAGAFSADRITRLSSSRTASGLPLASTTANSSQPGREL